MNGILFWRISMFYSSELWFCWTAHFQIFDFYYAQAPHKEMYIIQNEQKMTMLNIDQCTDLHHYECANVRYIRSASESVFLIVYATH